MSIYRYKNYKNKQSIIMLGQYKIMNKELIKNFDNKLFELYETAKRECNYNPTRFLHMFREYGGYQTTKKLLHPQGEAISDGLIKLWECKRLEISIEATVLQHPWNQLFTNDELATAKKRLEKLDFDFSKIDISIQDNFLGIILKVDFSDKSGIDANTYLEEFENNEWSNWNTPRKYKYLDTGKRLIFYDNTRKALTAEVEISDVTDDNENNDYPICNHFKQGTLEVFKYPIPIEYIRQIKGFEQFGQYGHDRSAIRNLTTDNYNFLKKYTESFESFDIEDNKAYEGHKKDRNLLVTERDRQIVKKRKEKDDYTCQACNFRLNINGRFIIECHHKYSFKNSEDRVTHINDLICLCPTCHRIAHIQEPPLSINEIKSHLKLK